MNLILIFVLQLFCFIPFFESTGNTEFLAVIFVFINSVFLSFYIVKKTSANIGYIILIAFLLRVIVLILDLYSDFSIIHSGADTERFNRFANLNVVYGELRYRSTNFTTLLTYIYSICAKERLIAQYLNIVLSITALLGFIKILKTLNLDNYYIKKEVVLISLFPTFAVLSSILLREVYVITFSTYSLLFFIQWYKYGGLKNSLSTMLFLAMAATMHAGIIFLAIGYFLGFSIWNPKNQKKEITSKSIVYIFIIICLILLLFAKPDLFLEKFNQVGEGEITEAFATSNEEAGSKYLEWINPTSLWQVVAFTPLKVMYFFFSPVPWSIRGINDLISILLDVSLYFYLLLNIWRYRKKTKDILLLKLLTYSLIAVSFAYAWGTSASGTAIRHRVKILILLFVMHAVCHSNDKSKLLYDQKKRK